MRYGVALLILLFIAALIFRIPIVRGAIGLIIGSTLLLIFAVIEVERMPHPRAVPVPVADTADDALWRQIRPDQIAIVTQALKSAVDDRNSMDYTATITNESDHAADRLSVRIRLYDCPSKPTGDFGGCFTIGDHSEDLIAPIPPRGSMDISGRFHFDQMREVNSVFAWRAEISKVHATSDKKI